MIFAEADFQIAQMEDMLRTALIKCKIDPLAMTTGDIETAGKQVKQLVTMQHGLDAELAKKIVKLVKQQKIKARFRVIRCG